MRTRRPLLVLLPLLSACAGTAPARREAFSLPGGFAPGAASEPLAPAGGDRWRLSASGRLEPVAGEGRTRTLGWPVSPVIVTSPFGERTHPLKGEAQFHSGVDLVAQEAQAVYAAESGAVRFAGWNGGYGNEVELEHDAWTQTRYGHLSEIAIAPGERVRRGQLLGYAGHTGLATGPHLHFEVRRRGEALDPEVCLPPPAPVLARGGEP